jgi:hypothetical protein
MNLTHVLTDLTIISKTAEKAAADADDDSSSRLGFGSAFARPKANIVVFTHLSFQVVHSLPKPSKHLCRRNSRLIVPRSLSGQTPIRCFLYFFCGIRLQKCVVNCPLLSARLHWTNFSPPLLSQQARAKGLGIVSSFESFCFFSLAIGASLVT